MPAAPDGFAPDGSALEAFAEQMRVLRRECAWKKEQTHTSLIPFVREEAEEVVEAIESGDPAALCDELGDLLLQVVIHAVIAEEAGDFTLDDVARGVIAKMERRNPHVFGDAVATDAAEVLRLWNAAKAAEKVEKAAAAERLEAD
jgi:MazG family protein